MHKIISLVFTAYFVSLCGCDQCGRHLFFFTDVIDQVGAAVVGAAVSISCIDALSGKSLTDFAITDASGTATPAPHALNRNCSDIADDVQAHASYFDSCQLTVTADGYAQWSQTFSGADLDALPKESAGQAGQGVRVEVTLSAL